MSQKETRHNEEYLQFKQEKEFELTKLKGWFTVNTLLQVLLYMGKLKES